jgi:hypothetical protein
MTRSRSDLSAFDRVDAPDLWERIARHEPVAPPEPGGAPDRRIGTIALALGLSILAIGFLAFAFLRSEPQLTQPLPSPSDSELPRSIDARVTQIVDTGLRFPEGAVVDETGIWVVANDGDAVGGDLLRIDRQTGEIEDRISLPALPGWEFGGGGIAVGLDRIWLAVSGRESGHTPTALYEIDPVSASLVDTIDVGDGSAADVWVDRSGIWVLSFADVGGEMWLYHLNPVTHEVLERHSVPAFWANTVASAGGSLWVLGSTNGDGPPETLFRIDPASGSILEQYSLNDGENFAIEVSGDRIWYFARGGLRAIDATTGQEIIGPLSLPDVCCAGLIADGAGGAWVVNGTESKADQGVWHVNREGGIEERASAPPGEDVGGIAATFDAETRSIWIVHYHRTVVRLAITTPTASSDPIPTGTWSGAGAGWTELAAPPVSLRGASLVWTGAELVLFGGTSDDERSASIAAYAFDPVAGTWSDLPDPPAAAWGSQGFWTGREALFWGGQDPSDALGGVAFDPVALTWRTIPAAPLDPGWGGQGVWTGEELIVFGGGLHVGDPRNVQAAAYDPDADTWRRLPDAPIGLNRLSGTWSGDEAVFLGSLQNLMNRAETEHAAGVAFDPSAGTWRELPASPLNPQAVSIVALPDGDLFAWDYETRGSTYAPGTDRWGSIVRIPLEAGECVPQTVVVERTPFAWYCAQAAIADASATMWVSVSGGITAASIDPGSGPIPLFQSATLAAAGDVVAIVGEGITIEDGIPCFGCSDAPATFWVYRP